MADNSSDDANPHGMFRPGAEGPARVYLVGSRIPKVRDRKKPRWLSSLQPAESEEPNEYFEDPDPAPPHGIPRPKLED